MTTKHKKIAMDLDYNNDGVIDMDDFKAYTKDNIVKRLDYNGDGVIDMDDFF